MSKPLACAAAPCGSYIRGGKVCVRHGQSRTRLYQIWLAMKKRCHNPRHVYYANYGGRGITICERWQHFENFAADMGEPPSTEHSIERKNNDGPYDPANCVWIVKSAQAKNKRGVRLLAHDGLVLPMAEWTRKLGFSENTIRQRLKRGWTVGLALSEGRRKNQWEKNH